MYSCVDDKLFHAQRGRGAFLNGEPLHVSGQEGDITQDTMLVWRAFKVDPASR